MSARSSATPSGSSETVGSSRIRTAGSLTSASAIPRRWRMPREYVSTFRSATSARPTWSSSAAIRSAAAGRGNPVEAGRVGEVRPPGQAVVEADAVGEVADASLDGQRVAGRVDADHPGRAPGRLGQSQEHEDGRGLARPVRTQEAVDLAGADLEREVTDGRPGAVALGQPQRLDDRGVIERGGTRGRPLPDSRRGRRHRAVHDRQRRPYLEKTQPSPRSTSTMRAPPTRAQLSDVSTVTRIVWASEVSVAAARNETL